MPRSTAGITQYFSEYKSKIEFKPSNVIIFALFVITITVLLHIFGGVLIG